MCFSLFARPCLSVALHREKMANIEKTEAAKAKLLAEQATRRDVTMVLPANYNSNFKLHKKGTHTAHRANASKARGSALPIRAAAVAVAATSSLINRINGCRPSASTRG
jgi:hypothetical protein